MHSIFIILASVFLISHGQLLIKDNVIIWFQETNFTHSKLSTRTRTAGGYHLISMYPRDSDNFENSQKFIIGLDRTFAIKSMKFPLVEDTEKKPWYNFVQERNYFTIFPSDTVMNRMYFEDILDILDHNFTVNVKTNRFTRLDKLSDIREWKWDQEYIVNFTLSDYELVKSPKSILGSPYMHIDTISWVAALVICIFLGAIAVLLLIFMNQQPLKSRGAVPLITSVSFLIYVFARSIFDQQMTLERIIKGSCYFVSFKIPLGLMFFLMVFQYFRFLTMVQLFKHQVELSTSISRNFQTRWYFRLLKWCKSPIIQVLVFFVVYLTIAFLSAATYGFKDCDDAITRKGVNARGWIGYSWTIFAYLAFAATILYDIVLSYKDCLGCHIKRLWKEDGYWFRFEFYVIFMMISTPIYITQQIIQYALPKRDWWFLSFHFMYWSLVVGQNCVFPLVLSMIASFRGCLLRRKMDGKKSRDTLAQILKDPMGHEILLQFAKSEYSIENILCYDDIERFKANPTIDALEKFIQKYLIGAHSEFEVNVPGKTCDTVKNLAEQGEIYPDMLVHIQKNVIMNIVDTFSRFALTSEYANYIAQVKFFDEVLEGK